MWYDSERRVQRFEEPVLSVSFYEAASGNEPVRTWLMSLHKVDRLSVDLGVRMVQYGWPLGMPVVRKFEPGLWEVRAHIRDGAARLFFTVDESRMVLLHGYVKKSRKTPLAEVMTARRRLATLRGR